jgi:CheY-like chemotaxis protein
MDKSLSGRRILLVEDEMINLMLIEDMLMDCGCESVTAAATVNQALALIAAQSFDLAILDVNLSGQKSYAIADALAARGVPFFFSTGYSEYGLREGYHNQPVLNKPFDCEKLVEMVTSLLPPKE